jgi:hypothetical protein
MILLGSPAISYDKKDGNANSRNPNELPWRLVILILPSSMQISTAGSPLISRRYDVTQTIEKIILGFSNRMEVYGHKSILMMIKPLWQMVNNFMGKAGSDPKVFSRRYE